MNLKVYQKLNYNQLSPGQTERLAWLAEELAECIQEVGKCLRHGLVAKTTSKTYDNKAALARELGHVKYVVSLLVNNNDLGPDIEDGYYEKVATKNLPLHHQ